MSSPYELRGEPSAPGTPLVFLHGFLGAPAQWDPVLSVLAPRAPVALARLPGHGPTPWYTDEARFEAVVDALAAALPFDRPAQLVGYSMGARVALTLAARHPRRVAGVVLVGVDPGLRTEAERAARREWDDAQAARLVALGLDAFADAWEALPLFATQQALPEAVRARQREQRTAHDVQGLAWAMRALGLGRMPPQWDALPDCPVPLRVVTGALDAKFTALGEALARGAWNASHVAVPGVGHNVALEAPGALADEVARALREHERDGARRDGRDAERTAAMRTQGEAMANGASVRGGGR